MKTLITIMLKTIKVKQNNKQIKEYDDKLSKIIYSYKQEYMLLLIVGLLLILNLLQQIYKNY